MNQKKIDSFILKLINDTISEKQSEQLVRWLEDDQNKKYFEEYIQVNLLLNRSAEHHFRSKKSWLRLKIKKVFTKPKLYNLAKYAAVLIVFFGLLTYYNNHLTSVNNEIDRPFESDKNITLDLGGNVIKVLEFYSIPETIKVSRAVNIEITGDKASYESSNNLNFEGYHVLQVPNGKKFQLTLADGTKANLNSGTKIKYPANFVSGKNREIYLLNGEAYFDVSKNINQKFIVHTKYFDIDVLGTKFNVSVYQDDKFNETVLLEGSINFLSKDIESNNKITSQLIPGQKASISLYDKNIMIQNVDAETYTEWINNKLIFKNTSFNEIIKKLERNYNVKIINNNENLGNQFFSATFENESIFRVMELFKKFYGIEYTIDENTIIIN